MSHFMLWLTAGASVLDPEAYTRNSNPSLVGAQSPMAGGAINVSLGTFLPASAHHFEPVISAGLYPKVHLMVAMK